MVYIGGGVVGGASLLILIILVTCHHRRRLASQTSNSPKTTSPAAAAGLSLSSRLLASNTTTLHDPATIDLDIPPSSVHILRRIGNARTGTVYIGNVATTPLAVASNPVIIKTLAGRGTDPATRDAFIARTRSMVGLRHCNLLALVGACLQSGTVSALYEHYDGVDLSTFIERQRALSRSRRQTALLMRLAADAACGLVYLSRHALAHGDVTASNVLVAMDADGRPVVAKVCELGLESPWCCCATGHHHGCLASTPSQPRTDDGPYADTAPELIAYGQMTEATDVWQFGFILRQIDDVIGHQRLAAMATDCCRDSPAHRPRLVDVHLRLLAAMTSDPVVDRVTGDGDLDTTSPVASTETGYSLLAADLMDLSSRVVMTTAS